MKKPQFKWTKCFLAATVIAVLFYPVVLALSVFSTELYFGEEARNAFLYSLAVFLYALFLNIMLAPVLGILYAMINRFAEDVFGKKFLMFLATIILLPIPSLLQHYWDNYGQLFSMWDWRVMGPYLGSSVLAAVLLPIMFKLLRKWIHMGVRKSAREEGERTVDDEATIIPLVGQELKIESFWHTPATKRKKGVYYITTPEYVLALEPKWSEEIKAMVLPVLPSIPYTASKFNINSDAMQTEYPSAELLDTISEISVSETGVMIILKNEGRISTGLACLSIEGAPEDDEKTLIIKFYSPRYIEEKQAGEWEDASGDSLIRGLAITE